MKMIMALGLLAVPVTAEAQWNTQCSTMGGYTNCRTNNPAAEAGRPYGVLMNNQFNANRLLQADMERRRLAVESNESQATAQSTISRYVGSLISKGKCDEALSYTLEIGALGMANDVKRLCTK